MADENKTSSDEDKKRDYDPHLFTTPLERGFEKLARPFQEFITNKTTSSVILLASTVLALILANSSLQHLYDALLDIHAGLFFGGWRLEKSLVHWINEGLMAIFFFVLGLEIKREFLVGELRDRHHASLLVVAAAGGMIVPGIIYYLFNPEGPAAAGWGIPMTTDTAFAIGVLALLGKRVHPSLMTFIAALAIIDDIGTVLLIAFFYTEKLVPHHLLVAALLFCTLVLFNLLGVRRPLPYLLVGIFTWLAVLQSGIHATVAGILVAFTVPARPRLTQLHFMARMRSLMARFRTPAVTAASEENILAHERQSAIVRTVEETAKLASTPLQRWEHAWEHTVALLVIPVFALVNSGISVDADTFAKALTHPVAVGITVALVVGKFAGITGLAWLAIKFKIGSLSANIHMRDVAGLSLLAGMGATISLFIAGLGFPAGSELLLMAKLGILVGSFVAGVSGMVWILISQRKGRVL